MASRWRTSWPAEFNFSLVAWSLPQQFDYRILFWDEWDEDRE